MNQSAWAEQPVRIALGDLLAAVAEQTTPLIKGKQLRMSLRQHESIPTKMALKTTKNDEH
jgi:hypothetical protein